MYRLLTITLCFAFFSTQAFAQFKELGPDRWLRGPAYSEAPPTLTFSHSAPLGIRGLDETKAVDTLHFTVGRADKKSQHPVPFVLRVIYDDLLRDTVHLHLDTLVMEHTFRIPLEHHSGRRISDIYLEGIPGNATFTVGSFRYHTLAHVPALDDVDLYDGMILFDQANTRQGNVMIVPAPINSPPHLYNVRSTEVHFTACIASPSPALLADTSELTVMVVDMGQDYIETYTYQLTGAPQEFRIDMGHQEVEYGYLVIFQPMAGQKPVALRHFRFSPMVK